MVIRILAVLAVGYVLGCVNGAIVISHLGKKEDVRTHGSGNAGLTNFLRSYGGWATVLVALVDLGKTALACLIAVPLLPEQPEQAKMLAGLAAQIGHVFPAPYSFRGGKGIMCAAGLALMMDWRIFAILFGVFLLAYLTTGFVSLGSVLAAVGYGIAYYFFFPEQPQVWLIAFAMAALAIFMHRKNIARLLTGRETKTRLRKPKEGQRK